MDIASMQQALAATRFQRLHHFASIPSTNTHAMQQAHAGAPDGSVYLADEQTAGRGRGGHQWHSYAGDGLYLSALIRPQISALHALKLSLAAGIAAQQAIARTTSRSIDIRWPNDLILNGLKAGGILTESTIAANGSLLFAVIGIGINVNHAGFPPDLATQATSLRIASGQNTSRESLATALLLALSAQLDQLQRDPAAILQRFTESSTWVHGKRVNVAEDEGYTGITEGLSATGLLRVRLDDGSVREVRHGGVREATENHATRH